MKKNEKQYKIIKCQGEFTQLSEWWIVLHEIPPGNKPGHWHLLGAEDIRSSSAAVNTQTG